MAGVRELCDLILLGMREQGGDGGCAMESNRGQLINHRARKEGKIWGER